jgi:hypothetical protein
MREPTRRSATDVPLVPPPATDGLGPFDQDRALSLADEGGVSAAGLESQETADDWYPGQASRALAICALAVVAIWGLQRAFRSRPAP